MNKPNDQNLVFRKRTFTLTDLTIDLLEKIAKVQNQNLSSVLRSLVIAEAKKLDIK